MSDKDIEIVFDFSINDGIGKQVVYKQSAPEHFGAAWDGHCPYVVKEFTNFAECTTLLALLSTEP